VRTYRVRVAAVQVEVFTKDIVADSASAARAVAREAFAAQALEAGVPAGWTMDERAPTGFRVTGVERRAGP
jgi:hypothetical protein